MAIPAQYSMRLPWTIRLASTGVFRSAAGHTRPSPRAVIAAAQNVLDPRAPFHVFSSRRQRAAENNNGRMTDEPPPTDFGRMDVLGSAPVPATSVDVCMSSGFQLNSGIKVLDGSGVLLIGGEAFSWRPWGPEKKLVNAKGQWEVDSTALGLLGLVWPRPDLLILGLGPEMRPLSPETKRHIISLGMRVEVLDTRNAASQFNLLATERGVDDVAAALIPIGWKEGVGAR